MPRDIAEARSLWLQSAERGHVNGMYNLGRSLVADQPDSPEALSWLRKAAAAVTPSRRRCCDRPVTGVRFPCPSMKRC